MILHKAESNGTAGYGIVRPVVWEDGGDGNIPASYLMWVRPSKSGRAHLLMA